MTTEGNPNEVVDNEDIKNLNKDKDEKIKDFPVAPNGNFCMFPTDTSNKTNKSIKPDIMNTLETILKKLEQLERNVNILMNKGKHTYENNNDEILKALLLNLPNITSIRKKENEDLDNSTPDIFKSFVSIYNSSSHKKSISINKELEEQVKELISKHYGIIDNDSKIINTALMVSLLKIK